MSTKATIGIRQGNTVKAVHLNYDGYPSYVMPELEKYDTEEKVLKLLSKGRIHEIKTQDERGNRTGGATFVINVQPFGHRFNYVSKDSFNNVSSFEVDTTAFKEIDYDKFVHDDLESVYYYLFEDGKWSYMKYDEAKRVA